MSKRTVLLVQANYAFGKNMFLPYSVGLLQAYCETIPEIKAHYHFHDLVYTRRLAVGFLIFMDQPDVVGLSSYIWNWEYNKQFARELKEHWPSTLIVMGGPQVPTKSEGFFQEHPYVDILVHYEGEFAFSEILLEHLQEKDYTKIPGLSVNVGGKTVVTAARPRLQDLSVIPSPYLTGVFDNLMEPSYDYHASQETHRGCPYSCTFCDWGSSVFQKVRQFDDARLTAELEWFAKNKIELLYNCDANYGLFPRDLTFTERMVGVKKQHGFPQQFRAAYAKKSGERIFNISKLLHDAGMSKGVTLSFQSLDENTLKTIKRENIGISQFETLMHRYHEHKIPTYTELIMGLPGETYDSFATGIDKLLSAGQHDSLSIYMCAVLPNSEMGDATYRESHQIESVRMPILLQHRSYEEKDVTEYNDVVVSTSTMPLEDWKQTYMFAWAVQTFHCLALTQFLAIYSYEVRGVSYKEFYEKLLDYAKNNPTSVLGEEYITTLRTVETALSGQSWDVTVPECGNTIWPTEEASFLRLILQVNRTESAISQFLASLFGGYDNTLEEILYYQTMMIKQPDDEAQYEFELLFNFPEFFEGVYTGHRVPLKRERVVATVSGEVFASKEEYARKVVWYGRKGGGTRYTKLAWSKS